MKIENCKLNSGRQLKFAICILQFSICNLIAGETAWEKIKPYFTPSPQFANDFGYYKSPLEFNDGRAVKTADDWKLRRGEILNAWHSIMGPWPALLEKPVLKRISSGHRDNFTQHKVQVPIAEGQTVDGYLLIPDGNGPFPAVVVPFYEPETSIGLKGKNRDFAYQLSKRGLVTLSIGSPGGDAWKPKTGAVACQPLSFLGYIAANCHGALANLPEVDAQRIGIVGHSYGGKWAMFGACLYEKFACGVWSDPGVAFDEKRSNVNYWEPWYLGADPKVTRKPGIPTDANPRTGAYKLLRDRGHDLHELQALMAPRPFLVSGGSEDQPERWRTLNHAVEVNKLLGFENRVGMTTRPAHDPTPESNEVLCSFFEHFLALK